MAFEQPPDQDDLSQTTIGGQEVHFDLVAVIGEEALKQQVARCVPIRQARYPIVDLLLGLADLWRYRHGAQTTSNEIEITEIKIPFEV
ncbi:MAG: hypothetical protein ACREP6_02585 [Candidatus Binataceae bacterium]